MDPSAAEVGAALHRAPGVESSELSRVRRHSLHHGNNGLGRRLCDVAASIRHQCSVCAPSRAILLLGECHIQTDRHRRSASVECLLLPSIRLAALNHCNRTSALQSLQLARTESTKAIGLTVVSLDVRSCCALFTLWGPMSAYSAGTAERERRALNSLTTIRGRTGARCCCEQIVSDRDRGAYRRLHQPTTNDAAPLRGVSCFLRASSKIEGKIGPKTIPGHFGGQFLRPAPHGLSQSRFERLCLTASARRVRPPAATS